MKSKNINDFCSSVFRQRPRPALWLSTKRSTVEILKKQYLHLSALDCTTVQCRQVRRCFTADLLSSIIEENQQLTLSRYISIFYGTGSYFMCCIKLVLRNTILLLDLSFQKLLDESINELAEAKL